MSRKVLVLGAGMVAAPLVDNLLTYPDLDVVVADQFFDKAQGLIKDHPRGRAIGLDINEKLKVKEEIAAADVVVSLLPFPFHPRIAECCIDARRCLVTTSYVGPEMQRMDHAARAAGILILNEVGLDPGLDHMEAMRIINAVKSEGGRIRGFRSFCGGLPAPEANTNPLGYKFSWSPMGVLQAGKNPAVFLEAGERVRLTAAEFFQAPQRVSVAGIGELQGYPNRDSLSYIDVYGIPETQHMLRGTLRYPGWCEFMLAALRLGMLDERPQTWKDLTHAGFLRGLLGLIGDEDLHTALAKRLDLSSDDAVIRTFSWLGFFEHDPLSIEEGTPLEILAAVLQNKLRYREGERDMVILQHEFIAEYSGRAPEKITSTLTQYGIPGGYSAMARTVGLPAALAVRLILEGALDLKGVRIPVYPQLYIPILKDLESEGIVFTSS